uniref:NADH dehydrogenase subunit 4 n=1 Tax=Thyasira tokunagai TaxID=3055801 RepID=UPI0030FE4A72
MFGVVICLLMGCCIGSFFLWCSLLVGVGFLFLFSLSLMSGQMESIFCVSESLISSNLNNSLVLLTLWVYCLSLLVSDGPSKSGLMDGYFGLLGLLTIICLIFFKVGDFFYMYLFFEGVLIPIIFMILGWGRQPERFESGLFMLIYTVLGSMPLLMCLVWFWGVNMSSYLLLSGEMNFNSSLAVFLISLAFCVKMPIFSVHGWLPKAHVEAPVAGSMMLAGILLKMGVYGLVMLYWFIEIKFVWILEFFSVVGALGGVISGAICLYQSDMKALIAYSSVSHMCFLMVGLTTMGWIGWVGVTLMAISHGVCSPWLFFLANYLSDVMGTRSLYMLKGIVLSIPLLTFFMFLGVCGNMAVPPCFALVAEISLFMGGTFFSMYLVFPMMILCFLAAAYSMNLYSMVNHGGFVGGVKTEGYFSSRCVLGSFLCIFPLVLMSLVIDFFI